MKTQKAPDLLEAVEILIDSVIGFSVNLRQTKVCWQDHQDVGVLFALATTLKDKIKEVK